MIEAEFRLGLDGVTAATGAASGTVYSWLSRRKPRFLSTTERAALLNALNDELGTRSRDPLEVMEDLQVALEQQQQRLREQHTAQQAPRIAPPDPTVRPSDQAGQPEGGRSRLRGQKTTRTSR